ncbi:MAG: zinc ribbon domain-containing protein [bacterium]|nr:zinc ribbon domain-containing protein [bacterium]
MSKTCTNCAAALTDGARFCANCGHTVAPTCDNCAAGVGADDKFCATCGAPQGVEATAPTHRDSIASGDDQRRAPASAVTPGGRVPTRI